MNKDFKITNRNALKRSMITSEDGLTYNVFNRLSYLNINTIEKILVNSFNLKPYNINFNELEILSFWPKWNTKELEEISNKIYIEPDLFLRFNDIDIIIEAKRYDLHQQSPSQWNDQITVYKNEYKANYKTLIFIALGGMSFTIGKRPDAIIIQSYWFQLAQACEKVLYQNSIQGIEKRVIVDILDILKFYGHVPLEFLGSLKSINFNKMNKSFKL